MSSTPRASAPTPPALAAWAVRRPGRALAAWLAFVVLCLGVGFGIAGVQKVDPDTAGVGDSGRADRAIAGVFGTSYVDEYVLVRRRDGSPVTGADLAAANRQLRSRLASVDGIQQIGAPSRSADGRAGLIQVRLDDTRGRSADIVPHTLAAVAQTEQALPALRVGETGEASMVKGINDSLGRDFQKAERLSLPIAFAILLVVFGALVAAALPLLLSLAAIAAAMGLAAIVSHIVPQADMIATMILLVGVAVGVDYALFLVRRARDERRAGRSATDAVLVATATSGRAIVLSGVTVIIAMAGLLLVGESTFTSMGLGSMLVVATAVLGSLTALPATLTLLGDRVERGRIPFLGRRVATRRGRFWERLATQTVRRPVAALILSAGLLVALAIPAVGMTTRLPGFSDLPRSIPAVADFDAMRASFPARGAEHLVVITPRDGRTVTSPKVVTAVAALERRAAAGGLTPSPSGLEASADGRVGLLTLGFAADDTSPQAVRTLQRLRDEWIPATVGSMADVHVGGVAAGNDDFTDLVRRNLPIVIGFVVVLTFLVMLASFRSATIAATTIALNALSVAAAYGLLVLVFQHHWFDGLLGVTTNGAIVAWLPLFMFVILFGLSMDYHVFVLSRIREAYRAGASASDAIVQGVGRTGGVVTSAAAIMIAAFAIFASLSTIDFKQLGVGLAAAILIDATIVRGVLLPATLRLLGDRAWARGRTRRPVAPVEQLEVG